MRERDMEYYRQRIDQELVVASSASDDAARAIHLGLAHAYAVRISDAASGADLVQILPSTDKVSQAPIRPGFVNSTE